MHETAQWLHPSHQRDWVKNRFGFVHHFPFSTSLGKSIPFSCVSSGCFLLSYRRQERISARKLCLQRFRQLRHTELNWTRPARLRKNAHSCPVYFFISFSFIFLLNPESSIPIHPIYPGDAWDGWGWMFSTSENYWGGQRLDAPEAVDLLARLVDDLVAGFQIVVLQMAFQVAAH